MLIENHKENFYMKKKILILVLLLIIYIVLSLYLTFINKENIVYLGSSTQVIIKNNDLKLRKSSKIYIKKAKVYYNGFFVDGYIRSIKEKHDGLVRFQSMTSDYQLIKSNEDLIAYTGNLDLDVDESTRSTILSNSEKNRLIEYAKTNNISGTLSDYYKSNKDIDKDGKVETIYSYTITGDNKTTTLTTLLSDDKLLKIDVQSGKTISPSLKRSWFYKYIDFDNDKKYEIVLYQSNGDDSVATYKIYKYQNGNLSIIE